MQLGQPQPRFANHTRTVAVVDQCCGLTSGDYNKCIQNVTEYVATAELNEIGKCYKQIEIQRKCNWS